MSRSWIAAPLAAALSLLVLSCVHLATIPVQAGSDANIEVFQGTTVTGVRYTRAEGARAGALFAAMLPENWNGKLVLLLHGQIPANLPVQLPPPGHEPRWSELVDEVLTRRYGVAYSSFRANGFAVKEGLIDTRGAESMFRSMFGKPEKTYLTGFSMGNHIGQRLIETSAARYDGLLAICGGLGGTTLQWGYFINARILFDYYFAGTLPGNAWSRTDADFAQVIEKVAAAVTASPEAFATAMELAAIDQLEIQWTTADELVVGIALSLLGAGGGTGDFQSKTGGIAIDNTQTRYRGSSDDDALNAGVARFAADPNAVQFLRRFDPDGSLRGTPVLALHATRDPVVSAGLHFPAYRTVLAEAENESLFVARLLDAFGHCEFSVEQMVDALEDLVKRGQ